MTSTATTLELAISDFDFEDEPDLMHQALETVWEFASGIGAEIDAEVQTISFRDDAVVVGISGHYVEVGLFNRRWFEE